MTFTPGMPADGSSLGNTRVLFVNELAGIKSTMMANHVDQNSVGAGKHTFCQFVDSIAGSTGLTELGLYNQVSSPGGSQRFFMRQPNNGTIFQMSGIDPIASPTAGCVFLPGALLMQWGGGGTSGTTTPVVFAKKASDGFSILALIGLSLGISSKTYGYDSLTSDGFNFLNSGGAGITFGYCVIGVMA